MNTHPSNPLTDLHRSADAEFSAWGGIEIVATFGEPQAEYAAVRKSAGMIDLPQRGVLELTGKDRHAFLNNLLTNQTYAKETKKPLAAGQGVYAFLLNHRGRIVCDLNVLELEDRTWLEMDARLVADVVKLFDQYLFGEQVKLADRAADLHEIALHGPRAVELLNAVIQPPIDLTPPLSSARRTLFDVDVVIWRDDVTGAPGYHLIVPAADVAQVWQSLLDRFGVLRDNVRRDLKPIGWAMFNTLRIEAGRPIFGIDFDGQPVQSAFPTKANREAAADTGSPGVLPAETGLLDRAVSFTKGCYLGQEIVARMHARQQVAKQIVGIRLDGDALPFAGESVYDADQNPIGGLTSSTNSPLLSGRAICLAFVKKQFAAPGTVVHVPAEGAIRKGTVVPMPFVEMP